MAGGSGFLGRPLATRLAGAGYDVVVLSRDGRSPHDGRAVRWTPDGTAGAWAEELDGAAAVINLAGESIAGQRWTTAQKARITESRLQATRSLVQAIAAAARRPATFISASAVGYYGPRGDESVTERTAAGRDFLAGVCVAWEHEAMQAASAGTRVVLVRSGLVLARDGGALPPMLPPFRAFVGGRSGCGRCRRNWAMPSCRWRSTCATSRRCSGWRS